MLILNNLEDEKDEVIKRKLEKCGMEKAIKIVRIEGHLTEQGLDKDMKCLMVTAIEDKPELFSKCDIFLHAITEEKKKSFILYTGTFKPMR